MEPQMSVMNSLSRMKAAVGPGLLMAAAAIGVSHLVQATRAGASFGFELLPLIILINFLKYPFFEYGHRFYAVTGKTLLNGYQDLGKPFLGLFLVLNTITALASVAGVTFVTAALCQNLVNSGLDITIWSGLILASCLTLLGLGQYKGLDLLIKVLMVVLLLTTLAATLTSLGSFELLDRPGSGASAFQWIHLPFLLALMGWMPAPIELSVWQSLWMQASEKESGRRISVSDAKFDFNFGYILTVILALVFCTLGATVMFGSGQEFSSSPAGFASQVVGLYTASLGEWSRPIISLAAFITMYSTTITLVDAYPRSLAEGTRLFFRLGLGPKGPSEKAEPGALGSKSHLRSEQTMQQNVLGFRIESKNWLRAWIYFNCLVALVIIWSFRDHLKAMVDLVTILAFLAAPVFSYLNLKLILSKQVKKRDRPGKILIAQSWIGIVFMSFISGLFLYQKFFS